MQEKKVEKINKMPSLIFHQAFESHLTAQN